MQGRVLIVDEGRNTESWLALTLRAAGLEVVVATPEAALTTGLLQYGFGTAFASMNAGSAEAAHRLIKIFSAKAPDLPLVMLVGAGEEAAMLELLQLGAFDCLQEGCCAELLQGAVMRAKRHWSLGHGSAVRIEELERLTNEGVERFEEAMRYLDRSYDVTLAALGDALELRDEETHGHSKRVAAYTVVIAKALDIPAKELRVMTHGAYLHDIGKIAIPDKILLKPDSLTPEDIRVMQGHCERGFWMVRKIPFLREAAEIVHSHHERWDGRGYPMGLRGEQIPLGARIFALADTLDAVTSDRTYRKAATFEHAYDEIAKGCGTQFDPEITKVFLSIPVAMMRGIRNDAMRRLKTEALSGERARANLLATGRSTPEPERHESRSDQIRLQTLASMKSWMQEEERLLR